MYKLLIIISVFIIGVSYAQDKPKVRFDAVITVVEDQGKKLDSVEIRFYRNNALVDSTLSLKGKYKGNLDTGYTYKIEFSKPGYIAKHLIVHTHSVPKDYKKSKPLKVEMSLFESQEGLDMDFLATEPIGVAGYNSGNEKIDWNYDYTRLMVEKIIAATLKFHKEKYGNE